MFGHLKSTWVKKYLDPENHGKWKYFFDSELQLFGGPAIFRGNLKQDDVTKYGFLDLFTKEILQIWSEVSFNPCVTSIDHFLSRVVQYCQTESIGKWVITIRSIRSICQMENSYFRLEKSSFPLDCCISLARLRKISP